MVGTWPGSMIERAAQKQAAPLVDASTVQRAEHGLHER